MKNYSNMWEAILSSLKKNKFDFWLKRMKWIFLLFYVQNNSLKTYYTSLFIVILY